MRAIVAGLLGGCLWLAAASEVAAQLSFKEALKRGMIAAPLPTESYRLALAAHRSGEYLAAMKQFDREVRGGLKITANQPWIDTACYHAMTAEAAYQTGAMNAALDANAAALELAIQRADWLKEIEFPLQVGPAHVGEVRRCPWGESSRDTVPADEPRFAVINGRRYRARMTAEGFRDAMYYFATPGEIVRTTALSLRRRREWLGAAAADDPLLLSFLAAHRRHIPIIRNDPVWSRVWYEFLLGMTHAALGANREATELLVRTCTLDGKLDHSLTATALCELGRLELARGAFDAAGVLFLDASVSAFEFGDPDVVEEALRGGWLAHRMGNKPGPYAPLPVAIEWAKSQKLNQLAATLLALQAESFLGDDDLDGATACLAEIDRIAQRTDLAASRTAAESKRIAAVIAFRQGRVDAGRATLDEALQFMERGSVWRQQARIVEALATAPATTPRLVVRHHVETLRDPTPADWHCAPLESLSILAASAEPGRLRQYLAHELRNEPEAMLETADLIRRERFYDTLPLGGRLTALRWTMHHPAPNPPAKVVAERVEIAGKTPRYGAATARVEGLEARLAGLPPEGAPGDAPAVRHAALEAWAAASDVRESLLWSAAADRTPCSMTWPPVRNLKEIQSRLAPRGAILAFFAGPQRTHAWLIERDACASWLVGPTSEVETLAAKFVAELGCVATLDGIDEKTWRSPGWRDASRKLFEKLTVGLVRNGWTERLDELAIVPDGALWYVPFEALDAAPTDDAFDPAEAAANTLGTRLVIRYAPTASLAVADSAPSAAVGPTVVLTGKPTLRDPPANAETLAAELTRLDPKTLTIAPTKRPKSPAGWLGWDALIAFDHTPGPVARPHDWSYAGPPGDARATSVESLLSLPPGGPRRLALPGFSTRLERGPNEPGLDAPPGRELFFATMALQATGVRTLLLSRWRTGGRNTADLLREFVQELPHASPAEAWQRAVLLAQESRLDLASEPRVKWSSPRAPKAGHPYLWAGYLLIDAGTPADAAAP